jgi:hypothetical protein
MKKNIILQLLFIFSIKYTYCQNAIGKIIFNNNDTIEAQFNIPIKSLNDKVKLDELQYGVIYYDSAKKGKFLSPNQAKEFSFTHDNELFIMHSAFNDLESNMFGSSSRKAFLKLLIDGKIKLFDFSEQKRFSSNGSPLGMAIGSFDYTKGQYIIQKENGKAHKLEKIGFKGQILTLVNDCPDLVKIISDGNWGRNEIDKIIAFYNNDCKSQ